jgi:hypothetical protein
MIPSRLFGYKNRRQSGQPHKNTMTRFGQSYDPKTVCNTLLSEDREARPCFIKAFNWWFIRFYFYVQNIKVTVCLGEATPIVRR